MPPYPRKADNNRHVTLTNGLSTIAQFKNVEKPSMHSQHFLYSHIFQFHFPVKSQHTISLKYKQFIYESLVTVKQALVVLLSSFIIQRACNSRSIFAKGSLAYSPFAMKKGMPKFVHFMSELGFHLTQTLSDSKFAIYFKRADTSIAFVLENCISHTLCFGIASCPTELLSSHDSLQSNRTLRYVGTKGHLEKYDRF